MLTRIGGAQNRILAQVLQDQRLNFLIDGSGDGHEPEPTCTRSPRCLTICSAACGRSCGPARRRSTRIGALLQNNYLTMVNAKLNPSPAQVAQIQQLAALGIRIEPLSEDARSEIARRARGAARTRFGAARGQGDGSRDEDALQAADHRIGEILDPEEIVERRRNG